MLTSLFSLMQARSLLKSDVLPDESTNAKECSILKLQPRDWDNRRPKIVISRNIQHPMHQVPILVSEIVLKTPRVMPYISVGCRVKPINSSSVTAQPVCNATKEAGSMLLRIKFQYVIPFETDQTKVSLEFKYDHRSMRSLRCASIKFISCGNFNVLPSNNSVRFYWPDALDMLQIQTDASFNCTNEGGVCNSTNNSHGSTRIGFYPANKNFIITWKPWTAVSFFCTASGASVPIEDDFYRNEESHAISTEVSSAREDWFSRGDDSISDIDEDMVSVNTLSKEVAPVSITANNISTRGPMPRNKEMSVLFVSVCVFAVMTSFFVFGYGCYVNYSRLQREAERRRRMSELEASRYKYDMEHGLMQYDCSQDDSPWYSSQSPTSYFYVNDLPLKNLSSKNALSSPPSSPSFSPTSRSSWVVSNRQLPSPNRLPPKVSLDKV